MTFAKYLAVEAYNNSQLKYLPDKPQEFHDLFISKVDSIEDTDAKKLGTALHSVLLEGNPVSAGTVIPRDVLNEQGHRKGGKWLAYKAAHEGETLITEAEQREQTAAIKRMALNVYGCNDAKRLLDASGKIEHPIFWTDGVTGLPLKMRLDKLAEFGDDRVLVDVKTGRDVSKSGFEDAATALKYHRQVAFYYEGIYAETGRMPDGFCFIAIKNTPPYNCEVYELSESAIELGRQENREALDDLKRRLDANDWFSKTHNSITVIDLKPWAYKREMVA